MPFRANPPDGVVDDTSSQMGFVGGGAPRRALPAKPKQHDLATSRYKRYYCVTKGVLHDRACGLRMCAACYEPHWDHDAKVLALTARQHYRNGELPPQASGK